MEKSAMLKDIPNFRSKILRPFSGRYGESRSLWNLVTIHIAQHDVKLQNTSNFYPCHDPKCHFGKTWFLWSK